MKDKELHKIGRSISEDAVPDETCSRCSLTTLCEDKDYRLCLSPSSRLGTGKTASSCAVKHSTLGKQSFLISHVVEN